MNKVGKVVTGAGMHIGKRRMRPVGAVVGMADRVGRAYAAYRANKATGISMAAYAPGYRQKI